MLAELPEFEHVDANSVQDAVKWLTKYGDKAKIIAGGTDLLGLMKDGITGPKLQMPGVLVNIKTIPNIDSITHDSGSGLCLGPAATLHNIEFNNVIKEKYTALAEAAGLIATTQIKFMGTIGGNLCQRPWCWYFRHPDYVCYKRGGKQCYAITGNNKTYFSIMGKGICVMSHPSDLAPALIVLDGQIHISGDGPEKIVPTENFFVGPRNVEETVLKNNELISLISCPEPIHGTKSTFIKSRIRSSWDFALASAAVSMCQDEDNRSRNVRIALGGVAPFPFRARSAEDELEGREITNESIEKAANLVSLKSQPLKMNAYKVKLIKSVVKKALQKVSRSSGERL